MAKFDVSKNAKEVIEKDNLIDYGLSVVGAAFQTFAPTLLGVNGWGGFSIAYGVPLLAGVLLGKPILVGSTINAASTHLMYHFFDDSLKDNNPDSINEGKGIWSLDQATEETIKDMPMLANRNVAYGDVPAGARLINVGGDNVAVYDSATMNDYIQQGEPIRFAELDDYVVDGENIKQRLTLTPAFSERI